MRAKGLFVATLFLMLTLAASPLVAAPFDRVIAFEQPDGTTVQLHGWGDEFSAVFETLDGYAVAFDHAAGAYCYAALSPDGQTLIPTKLQVGKGDPAALKLAKHLRISAEARKAQVAERRRRWEEGTRNSERWTQQKALLHATPGGPLNAPPDNPTTGTKVGLCLLIDFSDDVGTISRANIDAYCNGDAYTGYGNNGSVKKYFSDVSNATLAYTNVVTAYVRVPHTKDYYCDTTQYADVQANELIEDAIIAMRALPNYETEILPTFAGLTVDGSDYVVATNVFYAGGNGDVWAYGLWPHSYSLEHVGPQSLSSAGPMVWDYQITNIGSSLELGTFCHENGHMLCGFPDFYDYEYDSVGGAGYFCLMAYGGSGHNPVQICAYAKYAAGWTTTTELTSASELTATPVSSGAGFNHFYRYAKPGVPTEYYLLENRQDTGRDADLPAAGIAIWHVDELGDRDNQSLTYNSSHANYELNLVQADNLWHFQNYVNAGDANDLYYSGNTAVAYTNMLTDYSSPRARWWDGTMSGLRLTEFSASGTAMSVEVGGEAPELLTITTDTLPDGLTGTAYSSTLAATGGTPPYSWWAVPGETLSAAVAPAGGTAKHWYGDDTSWSYTLPFAFPYMGTSYTSVYVCSNGYLDFASSDADWSNSASELSYNVRIAPLWDDLITYEIYIHQPDADTVVIRWDADTYNFGTAVSFDVQLRRNGEIAFHYGSGNMGLSPTIGLGSGDPALGFLLSAHDAASTLTNAQTATFAPSLHSGLSFNGATAEIAGTPTDAGARDIIFVCQSSDGQMASKELTLNIVAVPRTLSVNSTPVTGVAITSATGHGGTTDYQQTVNHSAPVTLTAPAAKTAGASNYHFTSWSGVPDGTVFSDTDRTASFTMPGDIAVTAQYALDAWTLRVNSTPVTGIAIASGTGHGGTTNYQMSVGDNEPVGLTAPDAFNGQFFKCWQSTGGTPLSYTPAYTTSVNGNVTVVAAYGGLHLNYPSADGVAMVWGQRAAIQWSSTLPAKSPLKVSLRNSQGGNWDLGTATASKGVFSWTVGAWKSKTQPAYPQGDGYRIRISLVTDDTVAEWSDYPFSIGSVESLEITGANVAEAAPVEVPSNAFTQFTCKGIFNFGDPQDVTAGVKWRITDPVTGKSVKCAKMGKTGILATRAVLADTQARLTATYGKAPKGGTAPTASIIITVKAP